MDNKKLKFKKVKDSAKKFEVSGLSLEIKAKNEGALLECYQPSLKDKDAATAKKK